MSTRREVIICGAGILGISAAYFLAKAGIEDILLIDEQPPLSLTSDRSTECYRNWWPDTQMQALMNRSIDLMEQLAVESGNVFRMNRRGYLYVTGDLAKVPAFELRAARISASGGGPLRIHSASESDYKPAQTSGFANEPAGADLLVGPDLIHQWFPYLSDHAAAALHVRRAGWISAQQLGMHLLERGRALGVTLLSGRVEGVRSSSGGVTGITLATGERLECRRFVNAAGPYFGRLGSLFGVSLPVTTELHLKLAFEDLRGVVPRDAPLLIWDDGQNLPWSDDERQQLLVDPEDRWLAGPFPAGVHTRPEGAAQGHTILILWDYKSNIMEPVFPTPLDPMYAEVALRGLSTMLPGLSVYFGRAPRPQMDGGFYVKTPENRLLVGPTPVEGAYLIGAASGYGIMSACAAGELLAAHVSGAPLPSYADAFALVRYDDPAYLAAAVAELETGEL